ncbi:hypothetical protein [Flavobacterium cellulosilyticum]|uniref:DUF4142 domain-containing protein n=1 Tax=Flavobacterium cellulosilyticum TaxID=2541731 RepID=A0A4V2YZ88_9FLAO|nr:hypothetical protein [Flavobacterium cellulosilyticum]TDD96137.1 hypothetical protein E0F76_11600 [Flavobacterium cellulosilyticum]
MISTVLLCTNLTKEYLNITFEKNYRTTGSAINFNLINQLNKSNQKAIELSTYIYTKTTDLNTLQLILKIKKEQKEIETELKQLSEKNLIIIPNSIYNKSLKLDSSSFKNIKKLYFNLLETELNKQINIFDSIKISTRNPDFKQFAIRSLAKLNSNHKILEARYTLIQFTPKTSFCKKSF